MMPGDSLLADLQSAYGITPTDVTPVSGGYLNRNWKITDASGTAYLLKCFSPARYSPQKLERIEAALRRQVHLHAHGVCCPRVFEISGRIIRRLETDDGRIDYMLMSFENGSPPTPDTVTLPQMTALGKQCAHMHEILGTLDPRTDPYYPLDSTAIVRRLSDHRKALDAFPDFSCPVGLDRVLSSLDTAFFDALPRQLCHEDFAADNLLVDENRSVILDFDRGQYSFPLHDVGRVLMSLAFDGDSLRRSHVRAFADGYRRHRTLSEPDLVNALRVTAACEIPWWINPAGMDSTSPKVQRFVSEIVYLLRIWDDIPDLL